MKKNEKLISLRKIAEGATAPATQAPAENPFLRDVATGVGALVVGKAGAVAGSVVGPVGTIAGGIAGAAVGGAGGAYVYDYLADWNEMNKAYPELHAKPEETLLYKFKQELDNIWFNSDKQGILLYDALAYYLGFNYGYDIAKLEAKLKLMGVDFSDKTFEEMMNDDESGSYQSVKENLDKGRADKAKLPKEEAKPSAPNTPSAPVQRPQGGGRSTVSGGSKAELYEKASQVMVDRGYLASVQTTWTPEFDAAFRSFVDVGTASNANFTKTSLVSGQNWADAAKGNPFTPNESGALYAVIQLSALVPAKGSTAPVTAPAETPKAPAAETPKAPAESGKIPSLVKLLGVMYDSRLAEGGGFLSWEVKQTQTLVDAVGGPNPSGYNNAARVLLKRNPGIEAMLPAEITGPITKKNIKGNPLYPVIKEVQKTIHSTYEAANPRLINPRQEKATVNMKAYLETPAGGGWKEKEAAARDNFNRFVKLANDRKERIRSEVASELTPEERATIRKNKMRGAV